MDTDETLGEAIRRRCKETGKTLEGASLDLGLSKNALSRWATGTEPSPESYETLMSFLDVDLGALGALIVAGQRHRQGIPPTVPDAAWEANGRFFRARRQQLRMTMRGAQRAAGIQADATWRRLEDGLPVTAQTLYAACQAMELSEEEAQRVFDAVGLKLEEGAWRPPDALRALSSSLRMIDQGLREAQAAREHLEVQLRGGR